MTLVYACITPHGDEIIPELAENTRVAAMFDETREGMMKVANEMKKARPDTIVIASPHNLRLWKNMGIVFSENSSGFMESHSKNGKKRKNNVVRLSVKCDRKFARELYGRAVEKRLPVVGANYATFEGPKSDLPMDFGTLIPLWFLMDGKKYDGKQIKKPEVVIVSPSREIPLHQNVVFGREIAKLAQYLKDKRVAFVASADQAHTHRRDGIYGYHPAAKEFDKIALKAIDEGNLNMILKLDPQFIEDAKPDSVWQIAMLQGVVSEVPMDMKLFSYQLPTYYGMMCVGLSPKKSED